MKSASINISFAVQQMRFDGSFHLSNGLKVRRMMKLSPYELNTVHDVTKDIYCPGIFRRNYTKSGFTFLGGGDIQKADYNSGKYLKKVRTPNWEILEIKKGWTLVTCGGTIGDTVFANNLLAKCWISQHVLRVIPNERIKEGMLYAYLATKYGKLLLTTGTYGSVIPTISSENIAELPIPNFPTSFQQEVDDLIQQSAKLREQAAVALEKAKKAVGEYCGWNFSKMSGCKSAFIKSSNIRDSFNFRLDAPYFMNDGVDCFKANQKKLVRLGDCKIQTWYPGIFKRNYVENGYPYIKGSSLFETNPFRRCDHLSKNRTPMLEQLWLKEGMLMVSCAGVCGQVKMITKEYEDKKAIGSPDIIRLISKDTLFTTEYLFAYLQLPAVYEYLQSLKYGSVIERFDIANLENVPIVEPTQELSDKVTEMIKSYMDYTYQAFNAEEKAITMVEEEIEKWQSPIAKS